MSTDTPVPSTLSAAAAQASYEAGLPDTTPNGTPERPFVTDVTTEEWVEYHYEGGKTHRIANPIRRYIFQGKSGWTQRVVDADGVTHRPTPGWLAMSWKPRPGAPAFVA